MPNENNKQEGDNMKEALELFESLPPEKKREILELMRRLLVA